MAATRDDISGWFDEGIKQGATHLIVACDTFDWDDYPVYVMPEENAKERYEEFNGKNMQKVMEVYNLSQNKPEQIKARRVINF